MLANMTEYGVQKPRCMVLTTRSTRVSVQPSRLGERGPVVAPVIYDRGDGAPAAANIVPVAPEVAAVSNHRGEGLGGLVVSKRRGPGARISHVAPAFAYGLSHCRKILGEQWRRAVRLGIIRDITRIQLQIIDTPRSQSCGVLLLVVLAPGIAAAGHRPSVGIYPEIDALVVHIVAQRLQPLWEPRRVWHEGAIYAPRIGICSPSLVPVRTPRASPLPAIIDRYLVVARCEEAALDDGVGLLLVEDVVDARGGVGRAVNIAAEDLRARGQTVLDKYIGSKKKDRQQTSDRQARTSQLIHPIGGLRRQPGKDGKRPSSLAFAATQDG